MITRFAPSPTGPLHLGHAYSALLNHDRTRAVGGTFLLRIHYRELFLALGITFHVGLMASMRLGIFPYGVLAIYPAFFAPDEILAFARRVRAKLRRPTPEPT